MANECWLDTENSHQVSELVVASVLLGMRQGQAPRILEVNPVNRCQPATLPPPSNRLFMGKAFDVGAWLEEALA